MTISKESPARSLQIKPHELIGVILRRKWIVVVTLIVSAAAGLGLTALQKEQYVATAAIALDARKIQAVPQDVVVSRLSQESPFLRTEIDVIASRTMAEEVMRHLDKTQQPLIVQDEVGSTSIFATLRSLLRPGGESETGLTMAELQKRRVIDFLLSGLRVDNDGRSYTVFISFAAADPALAARVANAYADAYLAHLASIQTSATRGVSHWLADRLGELRSALENSERAVQAFRQSAELVEANGMTLQANRLNALNLQLIQVRAERAAAEARIDVARQYRVSETGGDAFAEVVRSPVIQNLRQQGAQIERAIQDLNNSGATQSVQLSSLKVQQASLRRQVDDEISRIVDSLASEVEVILRRENDLERAIAETWERTAQESKNLVRLQQLEREANANRAIYESFLTRYKQTIEQEGFVAPEARLISAAEVPVSASGRNPLAMLIFSVMIGTIGAGGLAFAVDRLDRRVRSGLRLEELVGLPVIGRIPSLPKESRLKPQDQVVTVPRSAYSEALRRLAAALQRSRFMSRAKVIVVTSSERGEGKSTTCISLARTLAATGKKVIVVDADLHRPNVAATFGYGSIPSLNDLVSNARSLLDIVRHDETSGADFVAANPAKQHPHEILQGSAFKTLIRSLRERYDFVIIDTPPVRAAVDAALVAAYADAVLLTVRWGVTADSAVMAALDELNIFSAPVAGIVLNGVDPRGPSYEAMDMLVDHPTPVAVRRQPGPFFEESGAHSRIHLKTVNVTRMNRAANDRPSTPPL